MVKLTNTAEGPRGVLLADETTRYLEAGETAELDVAEGHKLYEGIVEGDGGAGGDGLDKLNVADLTDKATELGVLPEAGTGTGKDGKVIKADLIAAIRGAAEEE